MHASCPSASPLDISGRQNSFRRIHRELAEAVRQGRRVTLTILENPPEGELGRREQELIRERGTLNGPLRQGSA
jgi:hypothetical protein